MVRRDRLPGQFDPSGRPIAMPSGAAFISGDPLEPLIISQTPEGRPIYSKTRKDERFISVRYNNVVVDSGKEFIVLDEKEAGSIHSVNVVTDNPYAQVYLEIDDFRNKEPDGECAAELFYQGDLVMGERRFKAINGGTPSIGYSMLYEPTSGEEYTRRLRLIIRNNIKKTAFNYGAILSYSSGGSLPTPATCGFAAGSAFHSPTMAAVTNGEMATAMTTAVGTSPYFSSQAYNIRALGDRSISLATQHPYIGIAGTPTFSFFGPSLNMYGQQVYEMVGTNAINGPTFGCKFEVESMPENFPGSTSFPISGREKPGLSTMVVTLTPDVASHEGTGWGTGGVGGIPTATALQSCPLGPGDMGTMVTAAASTETNPIWVTMDETESVLALGSPPVWFRNGGSVYFPGSVKEIQRRTVLLGGATATTASYDASTVGGGFIAVTGNPIFAYRLTFEPGLTIQPESFMTQLPPGTAVEAPNEAAGGAYYAHESYGWGTVISQASTNPHILIKKVEVKRYKKVSFEG